jgi:hypothetical protein
MGIEEEIVNRILNCLPSKNPEKNWMYEIAAMAGLIPAQAPAKATVDLREPWWDIGDQMDSGSCVGWGIADAVCRWHFVKKGVLQKNQKLSVRYPWMAAKEVDVYTDYPTTFLELEGTWITAALDIARKFGLVTDELLPFRLPDLSLRMANERLYVGGGLQDFYTKASNLKIAGYYNMGTNMDNWKSWLATKGPIVSRLDVDATWDNATKTNGNLDTYQPNTAHGGHCVAIVGYGYKDDRFIVRNSWGTSWGDKGFAYASKAYAQAAFMEAYGVNV